jgi:hypothetical protein
VGEASEVWTKASRATLAFVGDHRVRDRWTEDSSLPLMTVADLTGHLIHSGILMVAEAFAIEPVSGAKPITAAQLLSWVPADADDPAHAEVRDVAGSNAASGIDDLVARATVALGEVEQAVSSLNPDQLLAFPWVPTLTMSADELFRSRIVELAVHLDDLAQSIDEPELPLDPDAIAMACHVATDINVARHGPARVLRALCRPDRSTIDALRAF